MNLFKTLHLFSLLLLFSSCINSDDYSDENLPPELQFSEVMKNFHKRDFYNEADQFFSKLQSCRERKCSIDEEMNLATKIWPVLMTKRNEMSWKCDEQVIVKIVQAQGNEELIRPLLKRMKYCASLNEGLVDYLYEKCLSMLNARRVLCEKVLTPVSANIDRLINIQKLQTYD